MLSVISPQLFTEGLGSMAMYLAGAKVRGMANQAIMNPIKKIDNMIGRMKGPPQQPNPQAPPPVPSQPIQQPPQQQPPR